MVRIENDCCDCASALYPCTDCGLKRVKHYYCDKCKDEVEVLYDVNGNQLCSDCTLKEFNIITE